MADKKISQLTELTTAADDDSLVILDTDADVTKRIEVSNLVGTNSLLLKTAGTLSSSPQAVQSVGAQVSALQISSVGVKAAGTLTATGTSTLASATLSGDLTIGTGETVDTILDEDNLGSDDPNALATQQSIKAYVDTQITTEDTLAELNDTNISAPASGDVIIYDGSDSWDNKQISGDASMDSAGAVVVDGLQGRSVASTAPSDGESLAWDSGTSAWKPSAAGTGSVTSVAISGSDGIEVDSGSPITSAGTIALGLASVDATKIADGSVSDTEFQYIGGLTSDAQTQIDAKGAGTLTAVTGTTPVNSSGGTTPAISIDNATTSATGAASFSSDNFSVTAGAVSIKDNGVAVDELADIARGSIIYGNASAATAELTKGVGDSILTSDGTDLSWATSYTGNVTGNLTGNADTVTTNANLTGDVTSIGNATAIGAGVIVDADVKSDAAIAYSKLGIIPTWNQDTTGTAATVTGATQAAITSAANLATVGTIGTGVWEGTAVAANKGGTGQTVYAVGDILFADTTTTLDNLAATTSGLVLTANGVDTAPSWQAAAGGGDVSKVGTPVDSQVGVWTGDGTIEGTTSLVFDATGLAVGTTAANAKLTVEGAAKLKEQAAADGDTAAYGQVWVKNAAPNELWFTDDAGNDKQIDTAEIGIAASDDTTTLTTGDKTTIMIPRKMRVTEVKAMLVEATSTMDFKVDLEYNATNPTGSNPVSIFPATTYLEVTSSSYSGAQTSFDDGAAGTADFYDMEANSFLVVNVNSIGDGTPKGLKIWLLGYWN